MEGLPEGFFVSEEYVIYEEKIQSIDQQFYALPSATTDFDLTGQILWPGAKFLANFIVENPTIFENKDVLELGSGSGFCGLVCSRYCQRIIMSDGIDVVVNLLQKNKEFASCPGYVCKIDWEDQNNTQDLLSQNLPVEYDLIIGAECIYASHSILPLFNTVKKLLSLNGKFILCYTVRAKNVYEDILQSSESQGFSREVLAVVANTYIFSFFVNN